MRVEVGGLKEGCVLENDIFLVSGKPFMTRDTVLTARLITVLKKFFIEEVEIKQELENGEKFRLAVSISREMAKKNVIEDSIKQVENLFSKIASGLSLQFFEIRQAISPLVEFLKADTNTYGYSLGSMLPGKYIQENMVHSALLCFKIGEALKYDYQDCVQLAYAGLLNNIGLSKVDDKILSKLNNLSSKEKEEYYKHPTYSYSLIQKMEYLKAETKIAILQHHEFIDGTGFPFKLKAEKIHTYSQITAIVELYLELTSHTPFQKPTSYSESLEIINRMKHQKFRFNVVEAFNKVVFPIHNSATVILSNGQAGKIIFVNNQFLTKPIVQIGQEIIDLSKQKENEIIKIN